MIDCLTSCPKTVGDRFSHSVIRKGGRLHDVIASEPEGSWRAGGQQEGL